MVIGIISALSSMLLPAVGAAKEYAQSIECINNLRNLGTSMKIYHSDNEDEFWPCTLRNTPKPGITTYFWGTNTDPVDPKPSPLMGYCDNNLAALWCPKQPWGTYVPQGGVSEPTTNYGYNAWCLDPPAWGRRDADNNRMARKHASDVDNPGELFVFADSAMFWAPAGVDILQNSTHLEPVTGTWVQTPTTHFRHKGKANALCADGRADSFETEGWTFGAKYEAQRLGFVGTRNDPHYDKE